MSTISLLSYYRENKFNPVPIALEAPEAWQTHCAKRRNLYERHLGIPLALLRGRSILEFGCNSGENALALAAVGANLTLVEPNEQVQPRLRTLFAQFGLEERIVVLSAADIEHFESEERFDLVIAEGFLYTLPSRNEALQKIVRLLVPGGRAIISFNDRYGMLLEATRRMLLCRACQLAAVDDVHSEASLALAYQLYGQDFARLHASRPFQVWWKDTLVNPLIGPTYFWSYPELIPLMEKVGGEVCSCSPGWFLVDHYNWYKNVLDTRRRHQELLDNWAKVFPFFLTGLPPAASEIEMAPAEVIAAVAELVGQLSEYVAQQTSESLHYPALLEEYFSRSGDVRLRRFTSELKQLYEAVQSQGLDDLIATYHAMEFIRSLWGTPYHYLCISQSLLF